MKFKDSKKLKRHTPNCKGKWVKRDRKMNEAIQFRNALPDKEEQEMSRVIREVELKEADEPSREDQGIGGRD